MLADGCALALEDPRDPIEANKTATKNQGLLEAGEMRRAMELAAGMRKSEMVMGMADLG